MFFSTLFYKHLNTEEMVNLADCFWSTENGSHISSAFSHQPPPSFSFETKKLHLDFIFVLTTIQVSRISMSCFLCNFRKQNKQCDN
ncbi:hypothetical protein DERF_006116 [Dermatophagoides farinae]|uniref:Uncharacterized protein n=1 Tax=Dermatophagoides farinae TaxID=6954 RepID=A0A922L9D7_DERFA|nr:hypothetical protein DERF_006116 [Dermatophagoides farinae]